MKVWTEARFGRDGSKSIDLPDPNRESVLADFLRICRPASKRPRRPTKRRQDVRLLVRPRSFVGRRGTLGRCALPRQRRRRATDACCARRSCWLMICLRRKPNYDHQVIFSIDGFGVWNDHRTQRTRRRTHAPVRRERNRQDDACSNSCAAMLYGFSEERRKKYLPPVHGGMGGGVLSDGIARRQVQVSAAARKAIRPSAGLI